MHVLQRPRALHDKTLDVFACTHNLFPLRARVGDGGAGETELLRAAGGAGSPGANRRTAAEVTTQLRVLDDDRHLACHPVARLRAGTLMVGGSAASAARPRHRLRRGGSVPDPRADNEALRRLLGARAHELQAMTAVASGGQYLRSGVWINAAL